MCIVYQMVLLLSLLLTSAEVFASNNLTYEYHSFLGSTSTDIGQDIAVDSEGNIYIVGYSEASWNFPPGGTLSIMPKHKHSGGNDIVVIKYNSSGEYQWHTFYGSTGDDYGTEVVATENGVCIVGTSEQTWNGDMEPFSVQPKNNHSGGRDIVVFQLNSNGKYQWHTFFGSSTVDNGSGIAMDSTGNLFLSGSSYAGWNGPGTVSPLNSYSDSIDVVVVKLNSGGDYQWHSFYGSSDVDGAFAIHLDNNDNVVVGGESYYSWNGPGGEAPLNSLNSFHDFLLLKLDGEGNYMWHTFHGSPASDFATGIVGDSNNNIYVTGRSNQSWKGLGNISPLHEYSGSWDIFSAGFSSSGAYLWHTFYGSTEFEQTSDITIDRSGNLFMTGESSASWDGPGGIGPVYSHSNDSSGDLYILQLKTSGAYVSHAFLGSITGMDFGMGLVAEGKNVFYMTGKSDQSWLGPEGESPKYQFTDSASDIFLIKLEYRAFSWPMILPAIIGGNQHQ